MSQELQDALPDEKVEELLEEGQENTMEKKREETKWGEGVNR